MKRVTYKDGTYYEYVKSVRTVFGVTKVIIYDLKLTCKTDFVNKITRRVLTEVQPFEPVFWTNNGDGTATATLYGIGEHSYRHVQETLDIWHNN